MPTQSQLAALAALKDEVARSKRTAGVRFEPSFVRSADGSEDPPPLARLSGAGRGGEIRLKLFLTFAMRATRGRPTLSNRRPPRLARMLALPEETGPRRVADAMRWLVRNRFITISPQTGTPGQLLLQDGGDPASDLASSDQHGRYISVPIELWTSGLILGMSGRELAIYIALLDVTYDNGEGAMSGHQKRQYGISDDTWTRAVRELRRRRMIAVRKKVDDDGETLPRVRTIYSRVDPSDWTKLM
ncbi:MAG: hypothetical protein AAGC90_03695 [Curtobacterium sp.]